MQNEYIKTNDGYKNMQNFHTNEKIKMHKNYKQEK